jgi:hypothetical protein
MSRPKIVQTHTAFSMSCRVEINVCAEARLVWAVLTDSENFPRWNSTVTEIAGQIREGERLRVRVPGVKRTFTPTVSGVVPNERMTWADGLAGVFRGIRTFVLIPRSDGTTDFSMDERFAGALLPFVKGSMPDFGTVFAQYARDLKREAEKSA